MEEYFANIWNGYMQHTKFGFEFNDCDKFITDGNLQNPKLYWELATFINTSSHFIGIGFSKRAKCKLPLQDHPT